MRKLLGVVGVDSGQLFVCDPCYIDSQWKKEDFQDGRAIQDVENKKIFKLYKDFQNYETVLQPYSKTVNKLIEEGIVKEIDVSNKPEHNFSYNACCEATMGDNPNGQLNYEMGHAGVGVAFNSGLGDGTYEVWAEEKEIEGWGKRITKVEIILIDLIEE